MFRDVGCESVSNPSIANACQTMDDLCMSTNNVAPCILWVGGVMISDVRWFKSQR